LSIPKENFGLRWPSPVDDPHLFDVARPFHLVERHRLVGIRDAKDFGSCRKT